MKIVKRVVIYLVGLLIIALGINISKMSGLGIAPVSSVPRALEVTLSNFGISVPIGNQNLITTGNMVIVIYCLLVIAQLIVLRKDFKAYNILGVPIAIVFGKMVDLVGIDPKAFGHLLNRINFPFPQNYPMKLVYIFASIIIIGIGVFVYLRPNLVPMPAEGLAAAISQKTGKQFGNCKTLVDTSLITIALLIQLIFLGGFKSFTGDTVVVREGTILCAVCIGQVVKFLNKKFPAKKAEKAAEKK